MGQRATGSSTGVVFGGMSTVTTVPDAPPAFHLLAKPTGAVCNLDCAYWDRSATF
jgi:hypothetical protein